MIETIRKTLKKFGDFKETIKEDQEQVTMIIEENNTKLEIKYYPKHPGNGTPLISVADMNNEDNFAVAHPDTDNKRSLAGRLRACMKEVMEK